MTRFRLHQPELSTAAQTIAQACTGYGMGTMRTACQAERAAR